MSIDFSSYILAFGSSVNRNGISDFPVEIYLEEQSAHREKETCNLFPQFFSGVFEKEEFNFWIDIFFAPLNSNYFDHLYITNVEVLTVMRNLDQKKFSDMFIKKGAIAI